MIQILLFAPFQPTPGLAIWSLVIFLLFWFIMSKLAFKPIMEGIKTRESDIQSALDEAKKAKEEMSKMKAENETLLQKAREERMAMLNEAKEAKNTIIAEAKEKAKSDAHKIVADARVEIENQKSKALAEVKNELSTLALDIAGKVLQKELKGNDDQETFVKKLISDLNQN
jgi:F-type H+-transporting ATPase subunit b